MGGTIPSCGTVGNPPPPPPPPNIGLLPKTSLPGGKKMTWNIIPRWLLHVGQHDVANPMCCPYVHCLYNQSCAYYCTPTTDLSPQGVKPDFRSQLHKPGLVLAREPRDSFRKISKGGGAKARQKTFGGGGGGHVYSGQYSI